MEKDKIEELLVKYGVTFTDTLSEKIIELLNNAFKNGYEKAYKELRG